MSTQTQIAVFIDAENVSAWLRSDKFTKLLRDLTKTGTIVARRAYGKWTSCYINGLQKPLHQLGFSLVHTFHSVNGKNSADIHMTVDIMGFACRMPAINRFVIATGDSDFSPVFRRLREMGKSVIGIGPRSAFSETVKISCDRFIYTNGGSQPHTKANGHNRSLSHNDALQLLTETMKTCSGPVELGTLKNRMLSKKPGFDEKKLDYDSFLQFLRDTAVVSLYQENTAWFAQFKEADPAADHTRPFPAKIRPANQDRQCDRQ